MNLNTVFGTKIDQTQGFLENGKRVPLSRINIGHNTVTQLKTAEKDGYMAVQIAFGQKNKIRKSTAGHLKKAGVEKSPRFFREVRVEGEEGFTVGGDVKIADVLKPGDIISVTGVSKGKGYAGVVKRHGFAGGPRTHGQSDRERAPGSIGQSTTPGRVYKGKRMAGRMGNEQVTVKNLVVIDIDGDTLFVKGLVPGGKGGVIKIVKIGEAKNFIPLYKETKESTEDKGEEAPVEDSAEAEKEDTESAPEEAQAAEEEVKADEKVEKASEAQSATGGDEEKEVPKEAKEEQTEEAKKGEADNR